MSEGRLPSVYPPTFFSLVHPWRSCDNHTWHVETHFPTRILHLRTWFFYGFKRKVMKITSRCQHPSNYPYPLLHSKKTKCWYVFFEEKSWIWSGIIFILKGLFEQYKPPKFPPIFLSIVGKVAFLFGKRCLKCGRKKRCCQKAMFNFLSKVVYQLYIRTQLPDDLLWTSLRKKKLSLKKYIFLFPLRKRKTCLRCFSKGINFPSLHWCWKKGIVKNCTLLLEKYFFSSLEISKIFFRKGPHFSF